MGNVPVSCCRSKSPRLRDSSSDDDDQRPRLGRGSNKPPQRAESDSQQTHNLQHISEREPDDSETDPSSNPLDRPIFASRSSNRRNIDSSDFSTNYSRATTQPIGGVSSSNQHDLQSPSSDQTYFSVLSIQDQGSQADNLISPMVINSESSHSESFQHVHSGDTRQTQDEGIISSYAANPKLTSFNVRRPIEPSDSPQFKASNLLKTSSCSRIHLDGSTISQPDLIQTIKCVSVAIYYHIKNRTSHDSEELAIFDETINPLKLPDASKQVAEDDDFCELIDSKNDQMTLHNPDKSLGSLLEPSQRMIYSFVKTVFQGAQLTSEYAITTLVYLERLMTYAEIDLTPKTWRRMFLGAILLSSKVWEDQAVWNVDYAQILEEISVDDINELERHFLGLIQFNMNVPSSVYAKYYFHLRTLAFINDLSRGHSRLTLKEAKRLEVGFAIAAHKIHFSM